MSDASAGDRTGITSAGDEHGHDATSFDNGDGFIEAASLYEDSFIRPASINKS